MSSYIQKYSITLKGHRTSVSLEPLFWNVLTQIAQDQGKPLSLLVSEIEEDSASTGKIFNLSSAIRIYILQELLKSSSWSS